METNRSRGDVHESGLIHQPRHLCLAVAPSVHHLGRLVPRIAVERPPSHRRRTLGDLHQIQHLVDARALNRKHSTGLQDAEPFLQNFRYVPRPEVFDDVDSPHFIGVVIGKRKRLADISDDVGLNPTAVVPYVNTNPSLFSLVAAPEVEANTSIHFAPIKLG